MTTRWQAVLAELKAGATIHEALDAIAATGEIRDRLLERYNADQQTKPSLGWPRERIKAYWRDDPKSRVRVETLKRGDIFLDCGGSAYRYERPDGALSGVHHVETLDRTERTQFAGRAEVIPLRSKS